MRLIDADALMQEYARFVAPSNNSDFEDVPTWNDAVSLLGSAPTIEPQRMRGKWIKENIVLTSNPPQYQWHCSECGKVMYGYSAEVLTDFCPSCGADMRGTE